MSSKKPATQSLLHRVITRQTLKLLAGGRSFSRGEEYYNDGLVHLLAVDEDRASAQVHGTSTYKCKLRASGESMQGECTCPAFEDAGFCKHLVAMGLEIIKPEAKQEEPDIRDEIRPAQAVARRRHAKPRHEVVSMKEVRAHLAGLSHEQLVEILASHAMDDSALLRSLRLEILGKRTTKAQMEKHVNPTKLIESLKEAIDQGVEVDGDYDDWPSEYETAGPLEELVDRVEGLLKEGMANEVIELTEYFIAAVEPIIERFHEGGQLVEILEKLQEIHFAACEKAHPDPVELGRRLFRWEMSSHWSVFSNAPSKYKSILGEKGLDAYRRLAAAEWEKLPPQKERGYSRSSHDRYRITRIMENLAQISGDIEAEVAVHAKSLSSGYDYLKIAELYASRKMHDKAREWAEKGLNAFSQRPDGRLREFLAKEYHRLKRHEEAMALIWAEFVDHPSLANFKSLKSHAEMVKEWPKWREKAINHIQGEIRKPRNTHARWPHGTNYSWEHRCGSSTLVEIYLWEGNVDAAWKQAQSEGANSQLWYSLAQKRENTHPADAAVAYQKIVDEEITRGGNDSYRDAVKLIAKIQDLMKDAKQEGKFSPYLAEVRANFKAKRNFVKLLDARFGSTQA